MADVLGDFFATIRERPVAPEGRPGGLSTAQPKHAPESGQAVAEILDDFATQVLPRSVVWNHPRFFNWFTSSATPAGVVAEALAAMLNTNTMSWPAGGGLTELEDVAVGWVASLLGLAETHQGLILDGGSSSTLHGLMAARTAVLGNEVRTNGLSGTPPLTVYRSQEAHSSVDRAAVALGIGTRGIRAVPVDRSGAMLPESLGRMIKRDRGEGYLPVAVVATAGSTGRGAFDPLGEVAQVCRDQRVWLHVDAAWGGAAAALPECRYLLDGWEEADSVVVNPHKWLFVPLDLSLLFLRDREVLARTLTLVPSYLDHADRGTVMDPMDYALPLGRRPRALKLWMVLKELGCDGIRETLRRHLDLAACFSKRIADSDRFELVSESLAVVTFRHVDGPAASAAVEEWVRRSGRALVGHTTVDGSLALRVVVGHVDTRADDVEALWAALEDAADAVGGSR